MSFNFMQRPKIIGFSGTQEGMTEPQLAAVALILVSYIGLRDDTPFEFHHGDCIGADKQAHILVTNMFPFMVTTHAHPGLNSKKRAFCRANIVHPQMENLARNAVIAAAAMDGIIGGPKQFGEIARSGTWYTVRTAWKLNNARHSTKWRERPIYLALPDGSVRVGFESQLNERFLKSDERELWANG